ncbi:MAG: PAS domain S-box protein [Luteolibacter sp.]|uniref:sensor histidine kinase n=1 Tax=Luteolibacter sp. TaxID=1962973 RepID=UPI00326690E7
MTTDTGQFQEDYERFFALSSDLLCIAGMDGHFKRVNPAFSQTLGYTMAELLAKPFVDLVHPDDIAKTHAEMEKLGSGLPSIHFENRYRCRDGSWKWLAWSTQPFNEKGILYAVARDVTAKKNDELAILQLNGELLRQTVMLGELNRELESFSYSVSHDLRAPLRGISGFAQALEERAGDSLDATSAGYLQRVKNAAERMGLLIDDLIKLSRLTRAEMRVEPVNLSQVAEAVGAGLRAENPLRSVELRIEPDILVWADPALLEVLLDNLIGNAWKFTSKTLAAVIEIGSRRRDDGTTWHFVKDNGVGFDERYGHKLFGAFQRLHSQLEFPGTGIGLATVQRIVRRHGGEVCAKSVINHGATFEFTLGAKVVEIPHEQQDYSVSGRQSG